MILKVPPLPDGVFTQDDNQALQFVGLPPPSDQDIAKLLARVQARVSALLQETDDAEQDALDHSQQALVSAETEALQRNALQHPPGSR